MQRPIFDSLVETASDNHGYVTTLQARAAGLDPTQLRLLARILRSVRATVPLSGEPLFRGGLSHCDVAD